MATTQSFTMVWLLLVAWLAVFGDAKNLGPRRAAPLPSPAIAMGDSKAAPMVPRDHVFYSNYAKEMSVDSLEEKLAAFGLRLPQAENPKPKPRRKLWVAPVKRSGDRTRPQSPTRIGERGLPPGFPTSIPTKVAEVQVGPDNCVQCANLASTGPAQIGTFTKEYFIGNMLADKDQLLDTCLFYSAVFYPDDYVTWNTYFPTNPFNPLYKAALSHAATQYACKTFWTIWVCQNYLQLLSSGAYLFCRCSGQVKHPVASSLVA